MNLAQPFKAGGSNRRLQNGIASATQMTTVFNDFIRRYATKISLAIANPASKDRAKFTSMLRVEAY